MKDKDKIIKEHLHYVRVLASQISRTLSLQIDIEDLIAYGTKGLVEAATRYNPELGVSFITFAHYRIRGAIFDGLRKMGWLTRRQYEKVRLLNSADDYLERVNLMNQSPNISPDSLSLQEKVENLNSLLEDLISIYVITTDAMEQLNIEDKGQGIQEVVEKKEAQSQIKKVIKTLPERERKVIEMHYYKDMSFQEVGDHLKISKSWASRIHARAIKKLKTLLTQET